VLEEVARLGVRLLMQTAIEAEVIEFLGRRMPLSLPRMNGHSEEASAHKYQVCPPIQ
jgi:hypothetical protein